MTKDEALKMAIEFMDLIEQYASNDELRVDNDKLNVLMANAQQACKEALEQPAKEPVAWISVKDRLPKEVGRYLVYVEEIYDLGNVHYIWNAGFNPNDGIFQEETMKGATVTHWMNLPNTPNGISHYINPTHPAPSWQGLSDDEIKRNATKLGYLWTENSEISFKMDGFLELFARAIEQALRTKNENT